MKTSIVPAQVTTVEDRIAGTLTVSQLLLIVAGLGVTTLIYLVVGPRYHMNVSKSVAVAVVVVLTGGLSLRIQGKIVADWLVILGRFFTRPHRYVFTKNDAASRVMPVAEPKPKITAATEEKSTKQPVTEPLTAAEHDRAGRVLTNPALAVRFVMAEKGGIDVSLTPVKR